MVETYKKADRTCTITYNNDYMIIEYKTSGKTEYDAIYFWDRVD